MGLSIDFKSEFEHLESGSSQENHQGSSTLFNQSWNLKTSIISTFVEFENVDNQFIVNNPLKFVKYVYERTIKFNNNNEWDAQYSWQSPDENVVN